MRRLRRASSTLSLVLVAALGGPALAQGKQFCVGSPGTACDGGTFGFDAAGVAAAFGAADASAGADELRFAEGTITDVAPFAVTSDQGLSLTGAPGLDVDTTLIFAPGTGTAITITGPSTLTDLSLEGDGGTGVQFSGTAATAGARTVNRLRLRGFATGIAIGASTAGGAVIQDTFVDLGTRADARGLIVSGSGLLGASPTRLIARRVTLGGTGTGQTGLLASGSFGGNGTASLSDSVLYLTGTGAQSILCTTGFAMFPGTSDATQTNTGYRPAASGCGGMTAPTPDLSLSSPWFVNPSAGDYRLLSFSPMLDQGAGLVPLGARDALGVPRVIDGDGDGTAVPDQGAFEYRRLPPEPPTIEMPQATVAPGQALQFKASVTDPDGEFPSIRWDYGDGTQQNGAPVHAYVALGTYTATATATDPVGLTSTSQVLITVANPPGPPGGTAGGPTPTPPDPFFSATGPRVRVLAAPRKSIKRSRRGFSTPPSATSRTATLESAGAVTLRVSLTRLVPARKAGSKGKCRKRLKKGKRCTIRVRISAVGQIPVSPGKVILGFGGKLGKRPIPKGTYEVAVTPVGIDKKRGPKATYELRLR